MCIGMCVDMCIDISVHRRVHRCVDRRVHRHVHLCIDMCIDVCIDMSVHRHVIGMCEDMYVVRRHCIQTCARCLHGSGGCTRYRLVRRTFESDSMPYVALVGNKARGYRL